MEITLEVIQSYDGASEPQICVFINFPSCALVRAIRTFKIQICDATSLKNKIDKGYILLLKNLLTWNILPH